MQHLHLVTGLFSLVNSLAAEPAEPGDSHAVVVLYQSQPETIAALRTAAGRLLPDAPVVVLDDPATYRARLADPATFAGAFPRPDHISAFHTHSFREIDALAKAYPDASLSLVDEGLASYYPNLVGRHLEPERIERVHLHDYLDLFTAHETTGWGDRVRTIEPERLVRTLRDASGLGPGSAAPRQIDDRPVVVLLEQYFFQKTGVDVTIGEQAAVYAAAIEQIVDLGYAVEYRRHPREANRLFEETLSRVTRQTRDRVRLDTRGVALAELDLLTGNTPTAYVGVSSTTMLTAPHFFGVPAFRIETDLPLRVAQVAHEESAGLVNNHTRLALALPALEALPPAHDADRAWDVVTTHVERAKARRDELHAALFPVERLSAAAIEGIRTALGPGIDTVSFDAFDTLVVRTGASDRDVLALGDRRAFDERLLPPGLRFSQVRGGAPARMRAGADRDLADKPEYTLTDIYSYVGRALDLPEPTCRRLRALEVELETTHVRLRRFTGALLALCRLHGKRTLVVSDTFFDAEEFARIVTDKLPVAPDRVYLSSEEQATKSSGTLFDVVLRAEGIDPARVLHVGDSHHSDVVRAGEAGIASMHVPSVYQDFFGRSALGRRLRGERSKRAFSLTWSLVARKFFDSPGTPGPTNALGRSDPYFTGYAIVGPALLHWVSWIIRQAQAKGIDDLWFLARDGAVPLQIFELLQDVWPGAPRARYVYASRFVAVSVLSRYPGLVAYSEEVHGFGPRNSAAQVVRTRFGQQVLDELRPAFDAYGLGDGEGPLDDRMHALRALLSERSALISELVKSRSEAAVAYYEQLLDPTARTAVVDYGYSGSMQRAVTAATGRSIGGFYFSRKEANVDYADSMALDSSAFASSPAFFVNGAFVEMLITPPGTGTVLGFEEVDGRLEPRFMAGTPASPEIRALQRGILDLAADYVRDIGEHAPFVTCRPELASVALSNLLTRPLPGDVAFFGAMVHEDSIGQAKDSALEYWPGSKPRSRVPAPAPSQRSGLRRRTSRVFRSRVPVPVQRLVDRARRRSRPR